MFRSSILPTVWVPVIAVTVFSAAVAMASLLWGKEVGLTNNVGKRMILSKDQVLTDASTLTICCGWLATW